MVLLYADMRSILIIFTAYSIPSIGDIPGFAVHHTAGIGPVFGDGHDLYISPDAVISTARIGFTYQCPGGKPAVIANEYVTETFLEGFSTTHCKEYLHGDTTYTNTAKQWGSFTIDDWEVFVISRP